MTATVVNCREPHDVYVGRPSVWGNPFIIGRDGTREEVIAKYETWLRAQPELVALAKKHLHGKTLGCWCKPKACHGDVLAKIAEEFEQRFDWYGGQVDEKVVADMVRLKREGKL